MNQPDSPAGFYFKLSLGDEAAMFQEVSGLNTDMAVTDVSKYANLVLKRGFLSESTQFAGWVKQTIEGDFQKRIQTLDLKLSLMNADESVLAVWTIYKAWPVKWSLSDFNKDEANELAVDTLEFSYAHMDKNA